MPILTLIYQVSLVLAAIFFTWAVATGWGLPPTIEWKDDDQDE